MLTITDTKKGMICDELYVGDTFMYGWGPSLCGAFVIVAIIICAIAAIITIPCEVSNLIEWIIIPEVSFVKEFTYLISTM